MKRKRIAIVYMVAGLSSRFGGKIKQFAQVGANGETLIEVSMQQAVRAGFNEIVFIVGEKTSEPFKEKFNAEYKGVPVYYATQEFDSKERDKPWGTVDALVSAKEVIVGPFAVCNGDDLYGEIALKQAFDFLNKSEEENECASIGYLLGKVIPKKGKTNRGIFEVDKENNINKLVEVFEIEKATLKEKGLREDSLCSMNLFCLKEDILGMLEEKLIKFKQEHAGDRRNECLLPVELGKLVSEKKIIMKLIPTKDTWLGVTNPEDEELVRTALTKNV